MIEFMTKLKEGFFGPAEYTDHIPPTLKIFKHRKAVREALLESNITGKVIGVYSQVLGDGMFLVCVADISKLDNEEVISLRPYDMNGVLLTRNQLAISEIKSVCPFESFYIDPHNLSRKFYL